MGEGDLDRVLDRVQQLDDDVGDVAEGELPALVAASGRRGLSGDGTAHLQSVKQERLSITEKKRKKERKKERKRERERKREKKS